MLLFSFRVKYIYRKIQAEGLQEAYNNTDNRSIKKFSHMLLGLAFIPIDDVKEAFRIHT